MAKPFLVHKHRSGERVPETGIYRATHNQHRLPHEVVAVKGQVFPKCARCSDSVFFELAYAAPDLFESSLTHQYELPEEEQA